MNSYETLVDALKLATEALCNVPEVGQEYNKQHSDKHMQATLTIKNALNLAGEQQNAELTAINNLLSEVDAYLDYSNDDDMATATDKVKELFVSTEEVKPVAIPKF